MRYSTRLLTPGALFAIDTLLLALCTLTAVSAFTTGVWPASVSGFSEQRLPLSLLAQAVVVLCVWQVAARAAGLYSPHPARLWRDLLAVSLSGALGSLLLVLLLGSSPDAGVSPWYAGLFLWTWGLTGTVGLRIVLAFASGIAWSQLQSRRSVLIAGTGPRALRAYRELRTQWHRSHILVGFIDCRSPHHCSPELQQLYIGSVADIDRILLRQPIDEVFIALPAKSCYQEIQNVLDACGRAGVEVRYPDDIFSFGRRLPSGSSSSIVFRPAPFDSRLLVKRGLDIILSLFALFLLAPLFLLLACAVRLTSVGPVFFSQQRVGLGRRHFRLYKFRTMVVDAETLLESVEHLNEASGPIFKIRQDPRVTPVGAILRRTSLDELPQLFNVLVGHMSLVGPRPLTLRDVSRFEHTWPMRRFSVKPGLTCLWQIGGRSNVSFAEWMLLDLRYIDSWSLLLDARILAQTVPAVITGRGAM